MNALPLYLPDPGPGYHLVEFCSPLEPGDQIWESFLGCWTPYLPLDPGERAFQFFRRRNAEPAQPELRLGYCPDEVCRLTRELQSLRAKLAQSRAECERLRLKLNRFRALVISEF
jgi:hypothetical protein